MAAYLIVEMVELKDADAFAEYRRRIGAVMNEYDGEFLSVGSHLTLFEGEWHPRVVAILSFPTMDHIRDVYESPDHLPLRELRQRAGRFNFVAVEGI